MANQLQQGNKNNYMQIYREAMNEALTKLNSFNKKVNQRNIECTEKLINIKLSINQTILPYYRHISTNN